MITQITPTRRLAVLAVVVAVLIGPFIAWSEATGGETDATSALAPQGITVVGDSISAEYDDTPGSESQAWWSFVGRHFDAEVTTHAQTGSGYLREGRKDGEPCAGDRFIDRHEAFAVDPPSVLIVEGGRNDWASCVDGAYVTAPDDVIDHAVDRYLDALQTYLPSTTRVVVLGPPWGPLQQADGVRVTSIIEAQARAHGFEFISTTGTLTHDRVGDGVHPNLEGSRALGQRVIAGLE